MTPGFANACRWCGAFHGPRCPSVAVIEFHADGTVKRVEFVLQANAGLRAETAQMTPNTLVPDGPGVWRPAGQCGRVGELGD